MPLLLSWNIALAAFLAIIVTYSMILDRRQLLSVVFASFIAVIIADALHNILVHYLLEIPAVAEAVGQGAAVSLALPYTKIGLYFLVLIGLTRSGLGAYAPDDEDLPPSLELVFCFVLGALSGLMILSIILNFLTGGSFLVFTVGAAPDATVVAARESSLLLRLLLDWYYVWFLLPLLGFVPWRRITGM